jgi:TonB family protein
MRYGGPATVRMATCLFVCVLFSACAARTPPVTPPLDPPPFPVSEDTVDIRGIWRDHDLEPEGARRRGLDPSVIETPVKTRNVNPTYPVVAREARIQGDVLAYCVIGVDGVARDCHIHKSLGPVLDQDALRAINEWRFNPLRVAGTPRPALVDLRVSYRLH